MRWCEWICPGLRKGFLTAESAVCFTISKWNLFVQDHVWQPFTFLQFKHKYIFLPPATSQYNSRKTLFLKGRSWKNFYWGCHQIKVKFHLLGFIVHPQTASVSFYCSFSDILYFILYLYFQYLVLPTPSGWDTCSILTLPTPTELRNWWVQTLRSLSSITYFMSI